MIKTTNYSQSDIIKDIIRLHVPDGRIDLDPTYSTGGFYKNGIIEKPLLKFDRYPKSPEVISSDASELPVAKGSVNCLMFDPPFIVGHTKSKPTGIIGSRFHGFKNIKTLWHWYSECLTEFSRILKKNGVLIFKCQDTVSSGKQWFSHVFIINEAEKNGFYCKDLFILNAKNRIKGHNHGNQKHARKFHCYFLVFEKKEKVNMIHSASKTH